MHRLSLLLKLITLVIAFNISSCDCGNTSTTTITRSGDKNRDNLHEYEQKKEEEQKNEYNKEEQKKKAEQKNEQKKKEQKIHLSLALTYDESKKQLTYVIKNTGGDIAKDVKLIYKNVSTDIGEASVLLDGKKSGETALEDLAATTGKVTKVLPLEFNTQDKADFEFKVVCNGVTLEHLTKTQELKAPQVSLKLMNASSSTDEINLEDPEKKAMITIKQSGSTPDQPVELQITRTVGTSGYLSQQAGTDSGNKIIIPKLDGIDTARTLYITPEGDDELKFELQLFYKNNPIGTPLMVSWKDSQQKAEAALITAETAKEVAKKLGNAENVKAVQQAYVAAAQAQLEIAKNNQKKAENNIFDGETYAMLAFNAATKAAEVAKKAGKGLGSQELNQAVQQSYTSVAQAQLEVDKNNQKKAENSSYPESESYAAAALQAAKMALKVAREAKEEGFGSPENPEPRQRVKEAFEAAFEAYKALNNDAKHDQTIQKIKRILSALK